MLTISDQNNVCLYSWLCVCYLNVTHVYLHVYLAMLLAWTCILPIQYRSKESYQSCLVSCETSRVSRDKILVSWDGTLVSRYQNLVSRESLKRKFWNITEFLVRRRQPSFSRTKMSCDAFIHACRYRCVTHMYPSVNCIYILHNICISLLPQF